MDDYEQYEDDNDEIRQANNGHLALFEEYLVKAGLKEKTISNHLSNVDLFLNDYLLYYDAIPMEEGYEQISDFLGDFFIRKCMWSTPATIKSTAASIKKFYKCMLEHGKIDKEAYEELCFDIKVGMPDWLDDCEVYNDPTMDNPFFPPFF